MKSFLVFLAVFVTTLFILFAATCGIPESTEKVTSESSSTYQLERLFVHEGCTIYRFPDLNSYRYVALCPCNHSTAERN